MIFELYIFSLNVDCGVGLSDSPITNSDCSDSVLLC